MQDPTGSAADAATTGSDGPAAEPPDMPPAEPRQRWRLVVGRRGGIADQTQRQVAEAWESALEAAGLPVARAGDARSRMRVSFGAPLPVGMAADAELIDVVLTERWPLWRLREALEPHVPEGWWLVEAHDVWLSGPPLAGRVAAADHRVVLEPPTPAETGADPVERLADACAVLLASRRLERQRRKGDGAVAYDLRPLVIDVSAGSADGRPVIETRTRFHPELGTGRPEEVVGALGDIVGMPLVIASITRRRLVLADDLDER